MHAQTASILVIGNEILSGRTQDTNINTIAQALENKGIQLVEARIIADDIDLIIRHIHNLADISDIIFTTGGIGPTHDDKTAAAVAQAHNVPLILNDDAYQRLVDHYGDESHINDGRRKMAMIPDGADLIDNPVSAAPGFHIGKTYVMAGVPKIMASMLDNILAGLTGGDIIKSRTVICESAESALAPILEALQNAHPDSDIGSYPQYIQGGFRVSVVIRHTQESYLNDMIDQLSQSLGKAGVQHSF